MRKAEGIVLRRQEVRETSLMITAYTRELGKVLGLVKGIRGLRTAVPWYLEPASLQAMVIYERRRSPWALVGGCDLVESFDGIRRDLERTAYAAYGVDLVDAMTGVGDPNPEIFDLLLNTLKALAAGGSPSLLARVLEARLLRASGLLPDVRSLAVSPEAKTALEEIILRPAAEIGLIRMDPQAEEALRRLLLGLTRRALERDLKSRRFLQALGLENSLKEEVHRSILNDG